MVPPDGTKWYNGCGWKFGLVAMLLFQLGLSAALLVSLRDGESASLRLLVWGQSKQPGRSRLQPQVIRQEVESAVTESIVAALQRGSDEGGAKARTDVSRLLQQLGKGEVEAEKMLRKQLYCERYRGVMMGKEGRRLMDPWLPPGDKFLLPLCNFGQISNRLLCMRTSAMYAALLNRTLLVPQETGPLGYRYDLVFDVGHARLCSGDAARNTLMTVSEYRKMMARAEGGRREATLVVERVVSFRRYYPERSLDLWGPPAVSHVQVPNRSDNLQDSVKTAEELKRVVGALPERIISTGELYGVKRFPDLPQEWYLHPSLPLRNMSCNLFMQPHPAIVRTAKGMVRTLLGGDFVAIHWRRGDFHAYWNDQDCHAVGKRNQGCRMRPMAVVAQCIKEKMQGSNMSVVFAATNALDVEMEVLDKLLAPISLITAPTSFGTHSFPWAAAWNKLSLDNQTLAFATLDKLVCSMSRVFMGTKHSTFTDDIIAMRAGLGTLSCEDQDLCGPFQYDVDPLPVFNQTDPQFHLAFR